jgi:hypothetical protein
LTITNITCKGCANAESPNHLYDRCVACVTKLETDLEAAKTDKKFAMWIITNFGDVDFYKGYITDIVKKARESLSEAIPNTQSELDVAYNRIIELEKELEEYTNHVKNHVD